MKKIEPSYKEVLSLTDSQLSFLSALSGKDIYVGRAALMGRYVVIDNSRYCDCEPHHKDLEFSYESDPSLEIVRVYVGAKHTGPLLSWTEDGWCNLYGHGNHGKNSACGGTWSSGKERYLSLKECLDNRNYICTGLTMHKSRLKEGPALIEALRFLEVAC